MEDDAAPLHPLRTHTCHIQGKLLLAHGSARSNGQESSLPWTIAPSPRPPSRARMPFRGRSRFALANRPSLVGTKGGRVAGQGWQENSFQRGGGGATHVAREAVESSNISSAPLIFFGMKQSLSDCELSLMRLSERAQSQRIFQEVSHRRRRDALAYDQYKLGS